MKHLLSFFSSHLIIQYVVANNLAHAIKRENVWEHSFYCHEAAANLKATNRCSARLQTPTMAGATLGDARALSTRLLRAVLSAAPHREFALARVLRRQRLALETKRSEFHALNCGLDTTSRLSSLTLAGCHVEADGEQNEKAKDGQLLHAERRRCGLVAAAGGGGCRLFDFGAFYTRSNE